MADFDLQQIMPAVYMGLGIAGPSELEDWTLEELLDYANEELDRLHGSYTLFVGAEEALPIVANAANVLYPERRIATFLVALEGRVLRPANVRELEALDDDWEAAQAASNAGVTHYCEDYLGLNLLRLYPAPAANAAGQMLYMDHPDAIEPPDAAGDPIPVAVPAPLGDLFALRMIAEARRKDGDAAMPEAAQVCEQILKLYGQALAAYWGGGL